MDFNWDDMRVFLAIAQTGRLSAAGRRLGVSHTTVARRLRDLEARLGIALFDHGENGLTLSEAGQVILNQARGMERAASTITDRLSAMSGRAAGRVRVGAPDGFGNAILSRLLPELLQNEPDLEVELVPVPITHKLWRRDVDIAISLDRPERGRLIMRKLTDYDLRLYAGAGFWERHGGAQPTALEDLKTLPFVGYIDDLLYTPELDFNRILMPGLRIVYKAATVKAQVDAVAANVGLGVLPCFMADDDVVPVLPDDIRFTRTYWLLYPEDYRDLERIRRVADFIHTRVQAMSDVMAYRG
ncbi:MAG: LysR family transcriptional regulator [Pseudomonadota bacterium]|nr:LysR family transcriptional regulator [Pseudomonadota bacterium]